MGGTKHPTSQSEKANVTNRANVLEGWSGDTHKGAREILTESHEKGIIMKLSGCFQAVFPYPLCCVSPWDPSKFHTRAPTQLLSLYTGEQTKALNTKT